LQRKSVAAPQLDIFGDVYPRARGLALGLVLIAASQLHENLRTRNYSTAV